MSSVRSVALPAGIEAGKTTALLIPRDAPRFFRPPVTLPGDTDVAATDQAALVRALADPAFYPHRPASVEHVQTHISHVFLAGPYVYKLKKPVRFPFLDASTPARRRTLCEDELRLNWRLAAPVYLCVLPITRERDGRFALDGRGPAVDRVVWMRRLPAERMLDRLVEMGTADAGTLGRLARMLSDFHASAPTGPAVAVYAAPEALLTAWRHVLGLAAPLLGGALPPATHTILASFGPAFLAQHDTLLRTRQAAQRIRVGHGDLRAEHVCILDAPVPAAPPHVPLAPGIYVIDCIEFSHALRCNDIASEIAFLAMDLERLGRPDLADAFVDAYVVASGDRELRTLLPFYSAYRACVRGAVEGLKAAELEVEPAERLAATARARQYFALAQRHAWRAQGPAVVACCGLSGSGKTALATTLAEATGFVHLSTDVLRRQEVFRTSPAPYGTGCYAPAARAAVYARLCDQTDATLAQGCGVVADGTFIRRADREALAAVVARHGRPLVFLDCKADPVTIRRRLEARTEGPSDARWATYLRQREERDPFGPEEPHRTVDTADDLDDVLEETLPALWRWRTVPAGPAGP
jgi:aminoglycoside phosphotransferase family enzyme/predicted kinase